MKNAKRWLAILLAVTLLCSNGVSQLGTIVSASELETTEEAQPKEDAVVEQAEETKEDTGKATVEGVTPEEERGESSAQDAETANVPKAAAQEGQNEANVPEAAPATVAPTTATPATVTPATAVPASEGAGQQGEATAPEVQTYNVKINKSELDGGQIKAWGSDNNKVDVTEYDGNNQYVKEVKEGEEFNFQITLNDGFEIAQVKVNGNAFDPANTEGNVITYKVAGINEEKVIDVTYNKVETPAEKKAAEEPKTEDETKVEEPAVAETAEPEDNSVNTASLNENVSTVANTDTNRTVRVGQTITLDSKNVEKGFFNYTHEWTVNDNTIVRLNTTSGTSITVTGLKAGETIVTDAYTKQSIFGLSNGKKTYTITVRSAVTPTNITIEGSDKVTQFQTMQLTAKLTPADADGTVTWSSSNEQILSVDDKGVVTGRRQGEATVTASVQGTAVSTTKKITVEQDTATKGTKATVYFLLDPTKDPNSNDQSEWGEAYGTAVVNLENAKWVNDKNCFEDVDQRVISWPKGTNIIPRNSKEWDQIFNNYQATLKAQFGELQFSKDDVEEITLVPAKISKNNGTTSTSLATHLDCSVNIKCKNIALVKYYLFDAGGTGYVQQGSQNYIINDSAKTDPKSVIGNDFPETKTVSGVTYTFSGWYTDQSLTKPAPEFPAKVTASVDYYAKYIAGYQVMYNLAGGKFSDGSTSATEKHNVDTMVVVREQPTRAGYKFTGWTVEGLGETTSLNSGAIFTMPNGNVILTAKWEEQKIEEFLTLVPEDVAKPYDGTELQAGTAKVTGKVEGADTASVKIEYSLNGTDWTTNPSEITATNVSDSKTVQVRATSEKYTGELTGTEELTITPKPVTVTANSYNKAYGATDPEFTATVEGTLGSDTVNYKLNRETGEDVGTYKILAIGDAAQGNYSVTYYPGTLTITAATRPEDRQLGVTSYEGVYDANEHTITVDNVLDGDVVEYSYDGGETWTTNLNQYKDVTETTIKVRVTNANYDPSPVELEGTVKITPKPVTVTANSYNKAYGATDPEFTATVEGTLGSDTVNYKLNRETGEDVGTYKILAIGDAAQGNYSVTYYPGTLTITAATRPEDRQLGVTSYEGVYDANEHTITVDNVLDGDVVEYSYDGGETWTTNLNQYKDVTETTIKVRVTNANYDPSPVELEGTVKITPKPVTVTANSYNKAYGATDPEFTATVEGTLGSDTVNYKLNRETGEDVGTYKILAIGDAAQGNYSVTYYPGTLTITAATRPEDRQLGVTSYEGVYDANEHTITVDNVLDGDVVEYSYDGGETWTTNLNQYKDVTETTIKVRVTNANYDPSPVELEGTVKITPKPVTVTANSYNKAYGATDPEFTATVEGTLGSDTVNYKLNRETGEDVGTYKILAIGDAAQGNYSVTYYPGTLTITAATRPEDRQLGVTSYEGVYDANEHTITVDNVLDGDVVEYSYDGGETWTTNLNQYKDVTETTIKVRVTNANYDPSPVELEGTVKITPATLTVSTPIATKVYEGTPLTAAGTISGFVNDETATFATTGSQTEVGSTANTYSLTWDGTAKESNYKVVETIGTLTVTAQSIDPDNPNYKGITVDAPTDVEYTGEDQTWLPTVTDGNGKALVKDTDYTVTYDNEDRTNVTGIITVTINGAGNYAGTITRTYQITPKPVTITTEFKTRAFDGTALTAGGKVEGIVSGETYGFKTTGSQTYVGSSQNTYEMVWADSEVEGTSGTYTAKKTNYTVTESIGTLVVTAGTPENPLDPTLVVNKTHDKSQTYKAGDVITFTITAKNIYEEAKTITLEELEGVALDANVFENVASGAEVTATATYTVTEQDIVNGTFTNNVTVTFSGVDDKFTGTDTVDELEDANPHMTITKTTVGAEEGHIYKLNDVINYKITATNDGNLTLTNVKVEDALTGNVGENAFTIDILAPGEAQTFDVRYVVTENDVLEGKVINNATGTATDPTDPDEPKTPVTPGEKEDPIETPNPSLAVVKTSDKTGVVKLGETITYTITVTNNGNVTINDIEVTDELTGNTGDNAFTIDRLAVGETKQFTATYTVTEDDILEGTIVNRATATGKDPRNEEVTGEGEVRVDTEEKDDSKKDDSKKNDSDKKPGAVKTGDATDVIPFFGMTVLAAGAAIVIALKKKRRA